MPEGYSLPSKHTTLAVLAVGACVRTLGLCHAWFPRHRRCWRRPPLAPAASTWACTGPLTWSLAGCSPRGGYAWSAPEGVPCGVDLAAELGRGESWASRRARTCAARPLYSAARRFSWSAGSAMTAMTGFCPEVRRVPARAWPHAPGGKHWRRPGWPSSQPGSRSSWKATGRDPACIPWTSSSSPVMSGPGQEPRSLEADLNARFVPLGLLAPARYASADGRTPAWPACSPYRQHRGVPW